MHIKLSYWLCVGMLILMGDAAAQRAFNKSHLQTPIEHKPHYSERLPITELPIYQAPQKGKWVLFENGYAKYQIQNPEDWPPAQDVLIRPTKVRVIFTKYPKDSAFWLTDYQWLLGKRLQALFKVDSAFNSTDVQYEIVLQTSCDNEFEAMQLFHGIEVHYEPLGESQETIDSIPAVTTTTKSMAKVDRGPAVKKLKQWMYDEKHRMDSSVFHILDRNNWDASTLVLDWTGSMYGFGAEGILWQLLNEDSSRFEQVVLFNDGNRKNNRRKVIGYTGGLYSTDIHQRNQVIKIMRRAKAKGTGGDGPENDIEALLYALESAKSPVKEIVLIADNTSCIRDFLLLKHLKVPVRIILCKTKLGINHQYLNLAWKTGGSIHTDELDLYNIPDLLRTNELTIDGIQYLVAPDGNIMPNDRSENFFRPCNKYYRWRTIRKGAKKLRDPKCYF